MDNYSWRAKGPSDLINEGAMLSRPAAPLPFIFLSLPSELDHSSHRQQMVR